MEQAGDKEIREGPRQHDGERGGVAAERKPDERPHEPRPAEQAERPAEAPLAELLDEIPVGDRADVLAGVGRVHHAADHLILRGDLVEVAVELEDGERVGDDEGGDGDQAGGEDAAEDGERLCAERAVWQAEERGGQQRQRDHHRAELRSHGKARRHPGQRPRPATALLRIARRQRNRCDDEEGEQRIDRREVAELDGEDGEGVGGCGEKAGRGGAETRRVLETRRVQVSTETRAEGVHQQQRAEIGDG